jgi:hypothetical protein
MPARRLALAVLLLLSFAAPAALADEAADRAEFKPLAESCAAAAAAAGVDAKAEDKCLGDLLERKRAALADLLAGTSGMVGQRTTGMLAKAQREWEAYVKSTCAFHNMTMGNTNLKRGRFCELRLINQRYEEIKAGAAFADPQL